MKQQTGETANSKDKRQTRQKVDKTKGRQD